jgi:hypothetical protein
MFRVKQSTKTCHGLPAPEAHAKILQNVKDYLPITWFHIQDDLNLQQHCCQNLKSHIILKCIFFKCILCDTPTSTANKWYKYYNQSGNILLSPLYFIQIMQPQNMLHIKVAHWIHLFIIYLFTYFVYLPVLFVCLYQVPLSAHILYYYDLGFR